jgi:hypothetical protein
VTRSLLWMIGLPLVLWVLLAVPARRLGGGDEALWYSGTAVLICTVTMTLAHVGKTLLSRQDPRLAPILTLGASGLRMFVVLTCGVVLSSVVPFYRGQAFWLWLGVFYFATLALDVALSVKARPPDSVKPSAHGPV